MPAGSFRFMPSSRFMLSFLHLIVVHLALLHVVLLRSALFQFVTGTEQTLPEKLPPDPAPSPADHLRHEIRARLVERCERAFTVSVRIVPFGS